jgi:hypothetical protein
MAGGRCRTRGLADSGCVSSRLGVGQRQRAVFSGSIFAQGNGAARGPDHRRDRKRGPLGSRSALVASVSHFSELKSKLEVLGSGRTANLTEHKADVLWTRVRTASDSLASYVPSLVACNPPGGTGE